MYDLLGWSVFTGRRHIQWDGQSYNRLEVPSISAISERFCSPAAADCRALSWEGTGGVDG